jgi:hypothetical protein
VGFDDIKMAVEPMKIMPIAPRKPMKEMIALIHPISNPPKARSQQQQNFWSVGRPMFTFLRLDTTENKF